MKNKYVVTLFTEDGRVITAEESGAMLSELLRSIADDLEVIDRIEDKIIKVTVEAQNQTGAYLRTNLRYKEMDYAYPRSGRGERGFSRKEEIDASAGRSGRSRLEPRLFSRTYSRPVLKGNLEDYAEVNLEDVDAVSSFTQGLIKERITAAVEEIRGRRRFNTECPGPVIATIHIPRTALETLANRETFEQIFDRILATYGLPPEDTCLEFNYYHRQSSTKGEFALRDPAHGIVLLVNVLDAQHVGLTENFVACSSSMSAEEFRDVFMSAISSFISITNIRLREGYRSVSAIVNVPEWAVPCMDVYDCKALVETVVAERRMGKKTAYRINSPALLEEDLSDTFISETFTGLRILVNYPETNQDKEAVHAHS